MTVTILAPVLERPHRIRPLLESIRDTAPEAQTLFLCDPDDAEEILAVDAAIHDFGESFVAYQLVDGGYAAKINQGVFATDSDFLFLGADDLEFLPGWLEASRSLIESGAAAVVGVNDLIERSREHATHFLVSREYAERGQFDGEAGLLHEGYHHWYVDDELIGVACSRGAYVYSERARVRHHHPIAGGQDDDTYRKGRLNAGADRSLYRRRSKLWT